MIYKPIVNTYLDEIAALGAFNEFRLYEEQGNIETEVAKCRELGGYHDKLELTDYYNSNVLPVSHLNVFADGSTLIKFNKFVRLPFCTQVLQLTTKEI